MSDFEKKSKAPMIATIVLAVAALLAVAAAVVLITMKNSSSGSNDSGAGNGNFQPTQELYVECEYAAHDLVSQSYEVMRLFVFDGLAYQTEPYGNEPEDGLYTVNVDETSKYTKLEEIEDLVKSVYTAEAAEEVLHNIDGNGLSVYQKRNVLVEATYDSEPESDESRPMYVEEEVLGISADFKPDSSKKALWANTTIIVTPKSETSCNLKICLGGIGEGADLSSVSEDKMVEVEMIKAADGWRLTEFVC